MNTPAAQVRRAEVTVAVVVKDRRQMMSACLEALAAQRGVEFDVVVVDNGSTDGTYELLQSQAATSSRPFLVLQDDGPVARLRNLALRAASTPYVAFTDSDCMPSAGWLAGLLAGLADDVGMVQGPVEPDPGVTQQRWALTLQVTAFSRLFETANMLFRREPLLEVGGFDEGLGLYGEDTAAGWRLTRAGWRGAFAPEALVVHAVTHPGMADVLDRVWKINKNWPGLVRLFPEMRHEMMWNPLFLRRRDIAMVVMAATPLAVAVFGWRGFAAATPWLYTHRPRGGRWEPPTEIWDALAFDMVKVAGLIVGSVKHRTVVL